MTVLFFFFSSLSSLFVCFCLPRQSWWKFSACHPVRDAMRNKTKLPWNLYYFKSNWYDLRNSQMPHLCGRRTFWTSACARSSSGRGGAQRTRQGPGHSRGIVGVVRIRSGRNAVARSTWNFSGGFPVPALMVENRFQALPETSNRRFSSAEISGTGLICDWQNFWEKKTHIPE